MTHIQPILRRYGPDYQPSHVEPLGAAGGLSGAQFWRLTTPRGALVLRRWPVEHPTPDRLQFIHAVLRHAADRGVGILPVPIATSDGATFVSRAGHLWELAPWLPGVADYEQSPSVEKLRAAMTALAEFHSATAHFPTSPPLASSLRTPPAIATRLARLRDLQSGGADVLARAVNDSHWPELAPLARQFLAALPWAVPLAIGKLAPLADVQLPLQPCLRDIWHDHVLFDGESVTGLIDFGAMQIDTPATDVARLLGSLGTVPFSREEPTGAASGFRGEYAEAAKRGLSPSPSGNAEIWHNGLAAYAAIRPLCEQEVAAVTALDASGTILAGVNWIRWIYIDGRQFEYGEHVTARFARILNRIDRLKHRALGDQSEVHGRGFDLP